MGLFDAMEVIIEAVEAADEDPDAKEVSVVSDFKYFPFCLLFRIFISKYQPMNVMLNL